MHPHTFYSSLFGPTKRNEVFVIMSFAREFEPTWREVIEPAISEDLELTANRVDYNVSGESVVHDILDGIAHARLILADITSTALSDTSGKTWPQRNGNVMWELGIAHTMRLPDEVIMIRADDDPSIFDLTQFRAFPYDPSDPTSARRLIVDLATDRLRSVDLSKSDYVSRCVDTLDPYTIDFMLNQIPLDWSPFTIKLSARNAFQVTRLFGLGIVQVATFDLIKAGEGQKQSPVESRYEVTPFGREVFRLVARRMNIERVLKM